MPGVIETSDQRVVLVVADGVGGCPSGHKASAIAVQAIGQCVESAEPGSDLRSAILDGMETANRRILELGIGAATTLSVVEIDHGRMRSYQVGDSMSVAVSSHGTLRWKSGVHSPVGYAIESGMLEEKAAFFHEDRHYVSNLLGTREMHIEIGPPVELQQRDTVIVASDGLFDNVMLDEVAELGRCGNLDSRIHQLHELATARMNAANTSSGFGKPDDLSVLMFTTA